MRSAQVTTYGGPEVLAINPLPRPLPGPDEALVAVVASSINPVDVWFRRPETQQEIPEFPATLGWDLAGMVLQAPEDAEVRPGDRVVAMHPLGSWSELVAVPTERLVPAPSSVSLTDAATLPLAALTALQALARLGVAAGDSVTVTGGVGAVGGFAVELLRVRGVEVKALVSREEHVAPALALGAVESRADAGALGGADAVFDTAGVFDGRLLRRGGRFVTVNDGEIPPGLASLASRAEHHYVGHDPAALAALARHVDAGDLTLRIAARYPLAEVRAAHERYEAGGLLGKVVIEF